MKFSIARDQQKDHKKPDFQSFNKKAGFEVAVDWKVEAGLILRSDEIKSVRAHRVQLTGSFIKILQSGKCAMVGAHFSLAKEPDRSIGLLLNKKEIDKISADLREKGKTAVPMKIYFKKGWAKLEIGIGAGRKLYQKKELLKGRDIKREQDAELKRLKK